MSEPISDERLEEIRARAGRYSKWPPPSIHDWALQVGTRDLPDLLAEVARLRAEVADLYEDADVLDALRAAGVDNWGGYEDAMAMLDDEDTADA